jgi:hypothetical protein
MDLKIRFLQNIALATNAKIGHALSEYGLAIGLVVIVSISGLSLVGMQVSDLLGNTIGKRSVPKTVIATASPTSNNTGTSSQHGIGGFFLSPQQIETLLDESPSQTLDLGNGKKLTIPNPNLNTLSETIGPNGSTEVGLALLQRLQEALKAQGIDPNSIPEMGYFANTAHQTSDVQKKAEIYMKHLYETGDNGGHSIGNSVIAHYDNGSVGNVRFGNYQFDKDTQGNFTVTNYIDQDGIVHYEALKMKDLPVQEQMNLAAVMTGDRLKKDEALKNILPTFNTIWKNITTGTNKLANSIDARLQHKGSVDSVRAPHWLNTKIEANKACLLSKETHCLK